MHSNTPTNPATLPAELCGYSVERALTPEQTYLAMGPGGRRVVLKRVDEDCMLGNQLHPSIKERLARVRELAHGGVANLYGVGREGEAAWMIWEFVPGETFDEYAADPRRTPGEVLHVARELILAVDALHGQGIVHGSVIGANVIITPDGAIRLIHISPLLYSDMDVDDECVIALLNKAVEERGEQETALGRLVAEAARERLSLKTLVARLATLLEVRSGAAAPEVCLEERHIRRRTFLAAGIVGIVGIALAYGIWRMTDGSAELQPARWMSPNTPSAK